jgi:hypothetical protein
MRVLSSSHQQTSIAFFRCISLLVQPAANNRRIKPKVSEAR